MPKVPKSEAEKYRDRAREFLKNRAKDQTSRVLIHLNSEFKDKDNGRAIFGHIEYLDNGLFKGRTIHGLPVEFRAADVEHYRPVGRVTPEVRAMRNKTDEQIQLALIRHAKESQSILSILTTEGLIRGKIESLPRKGLYKAKTVDNLEIYFTPAMVARISSELPVSVKVLMRRIGKFHERRVKLTVSTEEGEQEVSGKLSRVERPGSLANHYFVGKNGPYLLNQISNIQPLDLKPLNKIISQFHHNLVAAEGINTKEVLTNVLNELFDFDPEDDSVDPKKHVISAGGLSKRLWTDLGKEQTAFVVNNLLKKLEKEGHLTSIYTLPSVLDVIHPDVSRILKLFSPHPKFFDSLNIEEKTEEEFHHNLIGLSLRNYISGWKQEPGKKHVVNLDWLLKNVLPKLQKGVPIFELQQLLISEFSEDLDSEVKRIEKAQGETDESRLNKYLRQSVYHALEMYIPGTSYFLGHDIIYTQPGPNPNPKSSASSPTVKYYYLKPPKAEE